MKHFVAIILLLFAFEASAQLWPFGKKEEPTNETINQVTSGDDTFSVVLTGSEFVELDKVRSSEATRATCFSSLKPTVGLPESAANLEQMRLLIAGERLDCGNGWADIEVAKENRKLGQTQARWGAGRDIGVALIGGATKGYLGGKAIDRGADFLQGLSENAGTRVEASDGGTIEVFGNLGEGNIFESNMTEQVSGILTNPADVNPINLAGETPVEEMAFNCVDLRGLLPTDADGIDANGDGLVCSDGAGGVSDN